MAKEKTVQAGPMYDGKGNLTLVGMRDAIQKGGSVSFRGRVISTIEGLPTQDEIAETPEELQVADADLDSQIAALQARKAAIADKNKPAKKTDDKK